jgi:hypothetical protein
MAFGGTPTAVTNEVYQRTDREAIVENEEMQIEMILRGGSMTCTATLMPSGNTVATATNVPIKNGYVGMHTRETKALFKNIRICEYGGE